MYLTGKNSIMLSKLLIFLTLYLYKIGSYYEERKISWRKARKTKKGKTQVYFCLNNNSQRKVLFEFKVMIHEYSLAYLTSTNEYRVLYLVMQLTGCKKELGTRLRQCLCRTNQ